jgi:hypothetical protein
MRNILNLISIIFIGTLFIFTSCGGEDEPDDPAGTFAEKLKGTWQLNNVTLDNSDVTNDFTGFAVNFVFQGENQGSFTIANANSAIMSEGNFSLIGTSSVNLSNGGENIEVNLSLSEDGTVLVFSFRNDETTFAEGRILGLEGDYVFELDKQ